MVPVNSHRQVVQLVLKYMKLPLFDRNTLRPVISLHEQWGVVMFPHCLLLCLVKKYQDVAQPLPVRLLQVQGDIHHLPESVHLCLSDALFGKVSNKSFKLWLIENYCQSLGNSTSYESLWTKYLCIKVSIDNKTYYAFGSLTV